MCCLGRAIALASDGAMVMRDQLADAEHRVREAEEYVARGRQLVADMVSNGATDQLAEARRVLSTFEQSLRIRREILARLSAGRT